MNLATSTGLNLDYWTLIAASNACYFTYMAAWPTLFSKQRRRRGLHRLRLALLKRHF